MAEQAKVAVIGDGGWGTALGVELFKFLDAAAELFFGAELSCQEAPEYLFGDRRTDDLRAEADYIRIVVFDALAGRITVVTKCRADAMRLIGGHCCANAGAALFRKSRLFIKSPRSHVNSFS